MVGRICRQASKHTFQAGLDTKVLWGSGHDFWTVGSAGQQEKYRHCLAQSKLAAWGLRGGAPAREGAWQ